MNENPFFPLKEPQGGPFYCEPLSAEHKRVLKTFLPSHPKGKNLASYLKKRALDDMANGISLILSCLSYVKPRNMLVRRIYTYTLFMKALCR